MSIAGRLLLASLVCAGCASSDPAPIDAALADATADLTSSPDRGVVVDASPAADADAVTVDDALDAGSNADVVDASSPSDVPRAVDAPDAADARACPGANLQQDPSNCGACGVQCCGGWCFNGTCGTEGPPGTVGCPSHLAGCVGPVPVQTYADPNNCGACGNACGTGCSCAAGTCRCPSADAGTDAATPDVALDVHVGDLG